MQMLLLPVLTSRHPPLFFADPRLLKMAPSEPISVPIPESSIPDGVGCSGSGDEEGCKLLDSFAILVQICLATTALLVLVYKRWRERPQRPVPVWALDVSKQFLGAGVIHFLNLAVSYLVGRPMNGPKTNLCVWYFLNVLVDTTIGVGILWFWLHSLQWILARYLHVRYIRSGEYGPPPLRRRLLPWARQTAVFIVSEALMKLCVLGLFRLCPFLFNVGNWALRWTRGNHRYQVVFVMFIFPLVMNAVQFWIVDTIVKVNPALAGSYSNNVPKYTNPDEHYPSGDDEESASSPAINNSTTASHNAHREGNERTPLLRSSSS
ncbi:vacuolar membrane protein-domain-containing protein [Zychaea mexicana]|uniref:vacuolar membrane protein-domain-containing protein n=1 Tax=Zychaea mexicana TaxID=64656 RepID=UPI0022FE2DB0|nr:vacuolar membrane protein-domain-containing protein [Zychaea mexicana]KAI9495296.1 vacuolar membrane protein-domain-containing protein [Zychaea mexicana]